MPLLPLPPQPEPHCLAFPAVSGDPCWKRLTTQTHMGESAGDQSYRGNQQHSYQYFAAQLLVLVFV
ncbi:hypothetical protein E2C01_043383 [Portunus trituberculatus]|uniref:Uncharacterized protein n=1 Tax=Portunus trituberculatus TaxID=210409 RepID=A0A5B7FVK9_PORTR|nr:hypothetical protein [Portunus trituberculatus]